MKVFLNCCKPTMFKGSEAQAQPIEAKKPEVKPEVKTEAKPAELKPELKAQPQKDTIEISAPKTTEAKLAKVEAKPEVKAEPAKK